MQKAILLAALGEPDDILFTSPPPGGFFCGLFLSQVVKIVMSVINSAERDGVFAWDEVEALLQALNLAVYRWRGC